MPDTDLNDHTDVNEDINTDLPESTAPMMNSQMDHKWSCFDPSAWPMLDSDIVIPTYVNDDIDADLPENSAPMMNSDLIVLNWMTPSDSRCSETVLWRICHPMSLMTSCCHRSMLM